MPAIYNSNDITTSGIITATSGVFTNLAFGGTTVSVSGHTHTASNITDFNSSVSGLLPVKNITAGNGITTSSSSGNFTINTTTDIINSSYLYLWSNFR